MAISKKSFKESLLSKDLRYCNDFFDIKSTPNLFTDSFSYNKYDALVDVNDIKTNNQSNLFLSKKQYNTNWLGVKEKEKQELNIVSTLSFEAPDTSDPVNPGVWLYFDKTYTFWDINIKEAPYYLTYSRPDTNLYNYFFYIEYLSDTECRICHNFGDLTFYLSVDDKLKVNFTADYSVNCVFNYNLQDTKLQLFKTITSTENDTTTITTYTLAYKETNGDYILVLSDNLEANNFSILYLNEIQNGLEIYLNNSYVGYDQSQYITAINREKSAFFLKSQALFHHQYNKDSEINFVPLKNNLTYLGQSTRGNNLTISYEEYPDVNYRNYATIQSGLNQEYGSDNIILNYQFVDQVYTLEDGKTLTFRIPSAEENNGKNPLWPYKKINIADTKFIKSGSFASDVPYFSDKAYKKQGLHTIITNENGERLSPNNGTYLCTWLYQLNEYNESVWLDRYYYPDKISRKEALTSPHFQESFENLINKNYDNEETTRVIKENTYFDKVSDLVFEPNNEYKYSRLSSAMVNEVVEQIAPYRIENVEDQDGVLAYLSESRLLDNKHSIKINHKLFNKTNALNFNTDLYITNGKKIGLQIFGSDYSSGFNIQNRKDLAPYHYYATPKVIYLLNNNFEIKHSFNLYEKYHDVINKFILGDVFDNLIAVSNLYLYIFSYDLSLKSKIAYEDIKDITEIVVDGIKGNLLNYPYDDGEIEVEYSGHGMVNLEETYPTSSINIGYLPDDTIKISYTEPEPSIFFETNISRIISEQSALIYKNNLYVPYKQNILKFIFVPDAECDDFPEEEMSQYPCRVRVLDYDEYLCNYVRTEIDDTTDNEPVMDNGFIEVENKIKNVYISDEGKIYGFNFDKMAISPDGDTVYGLYAWDKYINAGGWYWLYNQSLSKMESQVQSSKFAEFASNESIDWVRFNDEGMMCLIRGFFDNNDERRLEIYDKSKRRFYQFSLKDYEEIYSLDSFKYIDKEFNEHNVFTILAKAGEYVYRVEYQCDTRALNEDRLALPVNKNDRFYETTNSNVIMRHANENKLYFNLFLPTNYLYDYCETIEWDISNIQTGWYNINVHINLDDAKFEVKINDIPYQDRNDSERFKPYVNSNGTIFDTTYYLGQLGKKYGTTMNNILSDGLLDPYMCKDSKTENTKIYTKSLSFHEYQAMRLENKPINTLTLTLPCGQRSNLDEIVRYFKYVPPSAISNKVKINISGTGLTTRGEFEMLEKEIRQAIEDNKDCLVDVKDIEFI